MSKTICNPAQEDADCVFDKDGPCPIHVLYDGLDLRDRRRRVDTPIFYYITIERNGQARVVRKPRTGRERVGMSRSVTREDLEYAAAHLAAQALNTGGRGIIFPSDAESWAFYRATAVQDAAAFLIAEHFQWLADAAADWDDVMRGNQLNAAGDLVVDEMGAPIDD